jgi:choline dehydrogenase-like flavoprotein
MFMAAAEHCNLFERKRSMAYDYIIVGTGAGGSVLAERLSASGDNSVLVLEAGGGDWDPMHRVPKGWVFTMQNDRYVKRYQPEPFGDNVSEEWPRGIINGGSTTVNGLGWNTGESHGYDWDLLGNEGWNWDRFRAAFDQMENRHKGLAARNPKNGRMNVETVATQDEFGDAVIGAMESAGAKPVKETNLASGPRVSYASTNTRNGARWSAASAFLRPALRRKNVTLVNHAQVIRVIFSGKTAVGVEADVEGTVKTFLASQEVLICAGALESPMLLERSGIGDSTVLREAGVEVLVNSPKVGTNLSEHRGVSILFHLNDGLGFNHELNSRVKQLLSGAKYLLTRKGAISSGSYDVIGFLDLDDGAPGAATCVAAAGISYGEGMQPEKRSGGLFIGFPLYPTSRGSIHITGPRATDDPRIIVPYLQTDHDRKAIVKNVRAMRALLESPEMKSVGAEEYYPGPAVSTDDEIVQHALNAGLFGYHTLGTCSIGPKEDDVVDNRLRVRGVDGLRVVDASVFPHQPSSNNGGPTSAAAWIAADLILEDSGKQGRAKVTISALGGPKD